MRALKFLFLICVVFISSASAWWSSATDREVTVLANEPIVFDEKYGWVWTTEKDDKKLRFVLDTGASAHIMVKTTANELGLSCKNTPGYLYTGDGLQAPGMISDLGKITFVIGSEKHRLPFWCFDAPDFFTEDGIDGTISVHQLLQASDYTILDPLNQRLIVLKSSEENIKSYLQTYAGTANNVQTLIRQQPEEEASEHTIFVQDAEKAVGFDTGAGITLIDKTILADRNDISEILEAEATDAQGYKVKMHVVEDYNLVFCGNHHNLNVVMHGDDSYSLGFTKDKKKIVAVLGRDILNDYLLAFPWDHSEPILGLRVKQ